MPDKTALSKEIYTRLENENPVCIRTIRENDMQLMREGIEQMSDRSRYLRFFSGARRPPEWVLDRLLAADGYDHIAWGAIDMGKESRPAIGAVHAFRDEDEPACAEFSIAVLDEYHGLGLGKLLTTTILLDAQQEGISEFEVNILAENTSALEFTRAMGGKLTGQNRGTLDFVLPTKTALAQLRADCNPPGIVSVFEAFD